MDFKEKSPPNAKKSQKEVHIVEYVESKGYKYPTSETNYLKICAECHAITTKIAFRTHLERFHEDFSQSVMDKLVKVSPIATASKKTSMSPDDMISLVPWSIRYPELFQKLNSCSDENGVTDKKKQKSLWTNDKEYIELGDFLFKIAENSEEFVPLSLIKVSKDFIESSGSTRTMKLINDRIRRFRRKIHENEKFDTDTKVKLIFLLSVSVVPRFLKKIRQTAHVELDEEDRITVYKSETLNLQGDHSASAKIKAHFANKKRRESQIPVKNETEKPTSTKIRTETDGKAKELTEIVDLTIDSDDLEHSEKAQSEKSKPPDPKNCNTKAEASESKKEKSSESQTSNLKKLFLRAKSSKSLRSKSSITTAENDEKSTHSEPKSSIRRAPSVKSELPLPKPSNTAAPLTTKIEKDGKSIVPKAPKPEKKDPPSVSQFFPKVSKAPTVEKPKSSDTVAPPASESENESISEIEEPPKRQVSGSKSENKQSERVRIHMSGCPVTPKPTDFDSESDETYVCEEEKYCKEEFEEDTGEEEESDESSNSSEDESISKIEGPLIREVSDSESENEAENSEEISNCDEEDLEDCSVDDEEEEKEESEIRQTPPFRTQTANGNESIPPNSHKRFLKLLLIFVSNLDLPMLDDLEERIEERILEMKRFEMRSQEKMTINEIRACLMVSLLIVTKSATSSSTTSSTESSFESMISLSVFLELFKDFVFTLKWESLENFEQRLRNSIEELGEQDKRIPSRKVAFALQTIIEIAAP